MRTVIAAAVIAAFGIGDAAAQDVYVRIEGGGLMARDAKFDVVGTVGFTLPSCRLAPPDGFCIDSVPVSYELPVESSGEVGLTEARSASLSAGMMRGRFGVEAEFRYDWAEYELSVEPLDPGTISFQNYFLSRPPRDFIGRVPQSAVGEITELTSLVGERVESRYAIASLVWDEPAGERIHGFVSVGAGVADHEGPGTEATNLALQARVGAAYRIGRFEAGVALTATEAGDLDVAPAGTGMAAVADGDGAFGTPEAIGNVTGYAYEIQDVRLSMNRLRLGVFVGTRF